MVLDSLRYWVTEMHVDGFRFDLAAALGRNPEAFDAFSGFFSTVQQDPVLSRVKLIAEPWDVGPDGFQLGAFPPGWTEWNARYRDVSRRFWRGDAGQVPELASRLSGSSDIFQPSGRGPYASINFVTCHDGYTLHDLVSYEHKHNEANGHGNEDGDDANWSRNWGAEGETESHSIQRMRDRIRRNMIATLAFSQGVPMISHGDELGRTQRGNNNAYCLDDERSWVDWNLDERDLELLDFTRRVLAIRRANPVFRRRRFFAGHPLGGNGTKLVAWLRPDGEEMDDQSWHDERNRALGMLVLGEASDEVDERGRNNRGETLLLMVNGGHRSCHFQLPRLDEKGIWQETVNTARPGTRVLQGRGVNLVARSLMLLSYGAGE
jgi:glycogen operon protein